jgi:hypothetical protein
MTVLSMLDSAGRRRSPATMPGYHAGRALPALGAGPQLCPHLVGL